ncbi:hypothetical protein GCM10023329_15020 [Streptomyces sanyensis]|uniref:Uncharacterized protein n=1 Tax=Streptomyces sanyensis TaxID=568869 RepID=A0ABP8ZY62_9ACTN
MPEPPGDGNAAWPMQLVPEPPDRTARGGGPRAPRRYVATHRDRATTAVVDRRGPGAGARRGGGPGPRGGAPRASGRGAHGARNGAHEFGASRAHKGSCFSQLHVIGADMAKPPSNPCATSEKRRMGGSGTLRGRAMTGAATSLRAPRMERFVIECITPSGQVDIAGHTELGTTAPRDTVDSIMSIEGRGTRAEPRGNVQERKARNERGDAHFEGGLAS